MLIPLFVSFPGMTLWAVTVEGFASEGRLPPVEEDVGDSRRRCK